MEKKFELIVRNIYGANRVDENLSDFVINSHYEIFIVGMKSILLSENKIGAYIDEDKLKQELNLLREYFSDDKSVRCALAEDEFLFLLLLPSIMMNKIWGSVEENIVRLCSACSLSKDRIPSMQVLASAYFDYFLGINEFDGGELSEDSVINAKKRLIDFSLMESLDNIDKIDILKYEQARVKILEKFDVNIMESIGFKDLNDKLLSSSSFDTDSVSVFSNYIIKMRNGRINPKLIKYNLNDKPTFVGCIDNSKKDFNHPIMGICQIVNCDEDYIYLKTRIGKIRLKCK